MALSNRQKMQIIDDIDAKVIELNATSKPRQKMQIIDDLDTLMVVLLGGTAANDTPIATESPLEQKSETRTQDTNILFLQEVIAGQHDNENVIDLAQKVIDSSEIVVLSNDALVASAIDKFVSLDLSVFW